MHQAEGGDLKGPGSSDQQGLGNRREHQTGGQHPAAGVPQTLRNGLQEGRNVHSRSHNDVVLGTALLASVSQMLIAVFVTCKTLIPSAETLVYTNTHIKPRQRGIL